MSIFVGRKAHIGIHLEDDGDSGIAATPDVWLKRTADTSMDDAINDTLQNESDTGSIAHFNDSTISGLHGEGDVSTKLWFEDLYYILALAFGQRPTHTALADGAHQYDFTLNNSNDHLKATLFVDEPNRQYVYPHAALNTLALAWDSGSYPTAVMNFVSQKSVDTSGLTPAFVNDKDFLPNTLRLALADNVAGLNAATNAALIQSATMNLTKNVTGEPTTAFPTDYDPATIVTGEVEAGLSFEKYYNDQDFRNIMINNTKKAVQFGFIDTVNKAGTTNATSLVLTAPRTASTRTQSPWAFADKATESIESTVLFDLASGGFLSARLVVAAEYVTP